MTEDDRTDHGRAGKTLVTGATGDVGGTLTNLLSRGDLPFRVMCRRQDQIDDFQGRGIEAVFGDFSKPESVRTALDGCDQLFLVPPFTRELFEQTRRVIDIAREVGVRHIVKISAADATPHSPMFWAAGHGRADDYLAGSGMAWTVLRPSAFMGALLQLAPAIKHGLIPGTSGHGATTWIDSTDIAAAAHRVLTDSATQGGPRDQGRAYLLTGTQPLSLPQVATILTDQLHRKVRYLHIPAPVLYAVFRLKLPRVEARGAIAQLAVVVRRGLDDVRVYSTDLTELLGRPATDIASYVRQHHAELT